MASKKDYSLVARCIWLAWRPGGYTHTTALIDHLCREFKEDNPKFDETKFRAAATRNPTRKEVIL